MLARRVVHVITTGGSVAGAERVLIELASAAPRDVWELDFVTLQAAGELHEELRAAGYSPVSLGVRRPWEMPLALARFRAALKRLAPDVVHVHLHHAAVLGALATPSRIPLVQTRHYSDYTARFGGWTRRASDAWAARRASIVAAVSEEAKRHLVEREGVDPARVVVVENGVDIDRMDRVDRSAGKREIDRLGRAGPVLGCAASFHPRKGHDVLLRAFGRLAGGRSGARLVLLGDGPERASMERLARDLGVASRVHFLGYHPNHLAILSQLDVYIQPSIEEGFGVAVVEAMALGLPVVVSDVGGMRVTVAEGSGLRVPPSDPAVLAAGIERLLDDAPLRRKMGETGRQRVRSRYSSRRMFDDYVRCYERVLKD